MDTFIDRHAETIQGVLSCYDRIVLTGTMPGLCYPEGITRYFYTHKMRIFDFKPWAKPLRDEIRENAEQLADQNGLQIEFIKKTDDFRKERRIKNILKKRGEHPGLVHIFSAMESCRTYQPWHHKKTHKTYLKADSGRCLHYYFYFIDAQLGLCYLRVPTWVPFRLQFYCNGHGLLANQMAKEGIGFEKRDNAFVYIEDFQKAQTLSDKIDPKKIHHIMNQLASTYCPVICRFQQQYHWSIMQAEYATDILFNRVTDLECIYEEMVRTLSHAVKPDQIATFLGRKLNGHYQGELGSRFSTRLEGKCLKHYMGSNGIKMYDKFGIVLRIESVSNDITFFKHYRKVEHKDGTCEIRYAPMRKTIYSLVALREALSAANRRYLAFISAVDDPTNGIRAVQRISRPVRQRDRHYRGFNLFDEQDEQLLRILSRGEFNLNGFRNRHLRRHLVSKSPGQVSHIIKRLRNHGILKKVRNGYKYYLTSLGKRVVATALKIKEMVVIPLLRGNLIYS